MDKWSFAIGKEKTMKKVVFFFVCFDGIYANLENKTIRRQLICVHFDFNQIWIYYLVLDETKKVALKQNWTYINGYNEFKTKKKRWEQKTTLIYTSKKKEEKNSGQKTKKLDGITGK